jgi:hypothetical protein
VSQKNSSAIEILCEHMMEIFKVIVSKTLLGKNKEVINTKQA